jgi:hypothetical protein
MRLGIGLLAASALAIGPTAAAAQQADSAPSQTQPRSSGAADPAAVFDLGEIVVLGKAEDQPGVGGAVLTSRQIWTFDRRSLDQAVNLVPGVVSTFDSNGRRNESDVFVRCFGRWQVPLMVDGVRIYLPADNRLDCRRRSTTTRSRTASTHSTIPPTPPSRPRALPQPLRRSRVRGQRRGRRHVRAKQTVKAAAHVRGDVPIEQQFSRPTHPTLGLQEPMQEQSQRTWSFAVEDTVHVTPAVDVVGGVSHDRYHMRSSVRRAGCSSIRRAARMPPTGKGR